MVQYSLFITVVLLLCCIASSQDFFPDYEDNDSPLPSPHERIRRFVRFMSRKPGPDAEPEKGIGFKGHVVNLLKGGTLGMEFYMPHVNRLGRRFFPHWMEWLGNKGKKDEEKDTKDEEEDLDNKEAEDEEDFDDKGADDEDDVELADEGDNDIDRSDKREENELDYVHFINPRVKENEP